MDHIETETALRYVFGILSKAEVKEVEKHIIPCRDCLMKIAELKYKKGEACKRVESLFFKAFKNKLEISEKMFWNFHMKYCKNCYKKYKSYKNCSEK
mgnify:CR=1 FL=1